MIIQREAYELMEAVKMMVGVVEGFPDMIEEPSVKACHTTASEILHKVEAAASLRAEDNAASGDWTPTPWHWEDGPGPADTEDGYVTILGSDSHGMAHVTVVAGDWNGTDSTADANAARIVACVNAMDGVKNPEQFMAEIGIRMRELALQSGFDGLTLAEAKYLIDRYTEDHNGLMVSLARARAAATHVPDLLEACRVTLRMMEQHGQTHDTNNGRYNYEYLDAHDTGHSSALSDLLRSVIERATGGAK
jgi:hypothetical protein